MDLPTKEDLPIRSQTQTLDLTPEKFDLFKNSLGSTSDQIPPTFGVITMDTMFEITRKLGISDESLLHLSQRFIYKKVLEVPSTIHFYTELVQWRQRGKAAWATFKTKVTQENEDHPSVETEFKILVNIES